VTDILTDILIVLAIVAVLAGLVLIGTMLAGIYDVGPLAGWWMHRG
jgi:hypothetical protein